MGRILGIDYGLKRTGLAVTDPLAMIASPVETIPSVDVVIWIKNYTNRENVETIVVGLPKKLDLSDTDATQPVRDLVESLKQEFPDINVHTVDERFTSKMAQQTMISGGMKKSDRRKKEHVDKISAAIILQSYLENPQ